MQRREEIIFSAMPHHSYIMKDESRITTNVFVFLNCILALSPAVSRSLMGCSRRNIGGVLVGREGVNSTIEKSYVIFFNPSPQKRLFLRCLPYIAPQHRGEVLILSVTMTELCITLSSDASARE